MSEHKFLFYINLMGSLLLGTVIQNKCFVQLQYPTDSADFNRNAIINLTHGVVGCLDLYFKGISWFCRVSDNI